MIAYEDNPIHILSADDEANKAQIDTLRVAIVAIRHARDGLFMAGVSSATKSAEAMVDKLILSPTAYPFGSYVSSPGASRLIARSHAGASWDRISTKYPGGSSNCEKPPIAAC